MEKAYPFRDTLTPTLKGTVVGAVPGTLAGAFIPGVIGFALLGLTTPSHVAAYFTIYLGIVTVGALAGAAIGGSLGACHWVEQGCPQIKAAQMRRTAVTGALLALALCYVLWMVARQIAVFFF